VRTSPRLERMGDPLIVARHASWHLRVSLTYEGRDMQIDVLSLMSFNRDGRIASMVAVFDMPGTDFRRLRKLRRTSSAIYVNRNRSAQFTLENRLCLGFDCRNRNSVSNGVLWAWTNWTAGSLRN